MHLIGEESRLNFVTVLLVDRNFAGDKPNPRTANILNSVVYLWISLTPRKKYSKEAIQVIPRHGNPHVRRTLLMVIYSNIVPGI